MPRASAQLTCLELRLGAVAQERAPRTSWMVPYLGEHPRRPTYDAVRNSSLARSLRTDFTASRRCNTPTSPATGTSGSPAACRTGAADAPGGTSTLAGAQPRVPSCSVGGHDGTLDTADPDCVRGSFDQRDGLVRVSGREYNGLVDSPCFTDATTPERTLSCFSCHTMHKTPEDPRTVAEWAGTHQVSAGMDGDAACTQCHASIAHDVSVHTNHAPGSAGSRCYNCHMPYTSYGLLRAIRSHTVTSPSVRESVVIGRPNACNLCHLDRTLAWSADHLAAWYAQPAPRLDEDEGATAASILWLLRGDAGQRALTAWSYGWRPAQEASGTSWMPPYLGELLGDPYDAIRFIAAASLRRVPGFETLQYDFTANRDARIEAAVGALRAWRNSTRARARRDSELLFGPDGTLDITAMRRLFDQRDTRPLFLRE